MIASNNGCTDIVSLLLSHTNVDVNVQDKVNIYSQYFKNIQTLCTIFVYKDDIYSI